MKESLYKYVGYQMVMRNMLSESIGYRKWKRKKCAHELLLEFGRTEDLSRTVTNLEHRKELYLQYNL